LGFEFEKAFRTLAYKQFKGAPLFLEWAPIGVFKNKPKPTNEEISESENETTNNSKSEENQKQTTQETEKEEIVIEKEEKEEKEEKREEEEEEEEEIPERGCTLYIKNLNFITTEETLKALFAKIGRVRVPYSVQKNFENFFL
jgi:multiple RNA-binding domain-containing protein 1